MDIIRMVESDNTNEKYIISTNFINRISIIHNEKIIQRS